mmetsp:Transcript_35052/g.109532  ORF Transcript_35052/g.109532 Transcript_35052/m.109532 type:complete len:596 (-) Transcript_35052:477-2264(-)
MEQDLQWPSTRLCEDKEMKKESSQDMKLPKIAKVGSKNPKIMFSPCSPAEVIEMAEFLGVDWTKEFYLLPIVRKAIVAPFPVDWEISRDQYGKVYYHNKLTYKVISKHPFHDTFLEAIEDARKSHQNDLNAIEDEEVTDFTTIAINGSPWMRFTTLDEDSSFWFNFETKTLHTDAQYKILCEIETTKKIEKEKEKHNPSKLEKMQKELKTKKALQMALSSGLRAFWLRWQVHIMELRNKQATALLKAGLIEGRQEAKGFRQWKEKSEQLSFVRRALAPLGGRRDKAIRRDAFRGWHEVVLAEVEEKKDREFLLSIISSWKEKSKTTSHLNNVKKIIQNLLTSNSISLNFGEWRELARESKSLRIHIMSEACIKIQRQYRARRATKDAAKESVNLRKQMKYRLLRIGNTSEEEIPGRSEQSMKQSSDDEGEGGSLLLHLLEGAMHKTEEEQEKVRLKKIAKEARTKASLEPSEDGFGLASVKNDINRIAELLDPTGRDEFLKSNQAIPAEESYKTLNDSINTLFDKFVNVQNNNRGIMQEIAADLLDSQEGENLAMVATRAKQHLDKVALPCIPVLLLMKLPAIKSFRYALKYECN